MERTKRHEFLIPIIFSIIGLCISVVFISPKIKPTDSVSTGFCHFLFTLVFGVVSYLAVLVVKKLVKPLTPDAGVSLIITQAPNQFIDMFLQANEEGIIFNVQVRHWIELLRSAIDYIPRDGNWFGTYILHPDSWINFAAFGWEYNESLRKRSDINKVRCMIQPLKRIKKCEIFNSIIVQDSKSAGVKLCIIAKEKIKDIVRKLGLQDFALFNNEFTVCGRQIPKIENLDLDTVISIEMAKGQAINIYKQYKDWLLNINPEQKCVK